MYQIRIELIQHLIKLRNKALRAGRLNRAYELTRWIKYIDHIASNREIAEYYLQYWNTTHNQSRLKQLPLFKVS